MLRESSLLSIDATLLEADALFDDDDGVELLRWPADDDRRRELPPAQPRLLLLAEGVAPPRNIDLLEDWVREPIDPEEVRARRAALVRRAGCAGHGPVLDDDGLLWWGDRWVSIPSAQEPVVRMLIDNVRELVRRQDLVAVYHAAGGSDDPVAVKAMLGRLVRRCAEVGLALQAVRGRGYLLDAPNPCPLHATVPPSGKTPTAVVTGPVTRSERAT